MILFSLDSYGKTAGAALWRDGTFLYEATLATGLTHSESLLPLCAEAFRAAGVAPADVDLYAVCAGPGSFTGLRIGLATVKGLAAPHGTLTAPVSTLEAAALASGAEGTIIAALDARRQEVYWAAFQVENGLCRRLTPDAAAPVSALAETVKSAPGPVTFVGDGAPLCRAAFQEDPRVRPASPLPLPMACGAALAGLRMHEAGGAVPPAQLVPSYHRLSQAEREMREKQTKGREKI